ncbi:MAG: NAD(P)-dependent glycerol-3-phosphate dehydrogenase [Deltaproteobacteria bacterium]|nr:MAG: NAD(P)-dependent glycerol-3-phosphate dehydrogenase [Deltaproteobacteria bacterium]
MNEASSDRLDVGVIGAGSWGTALAFLLADRGHQVTLWAHEPEVSAAINERHENTVFLSDIRLPDNLGATSDLEEACRGRDMIVTVTPSHVTRRVLTEAAPYLPRHVPIVSATKGIENETLLTVSEILEEVLPVEFHPYLAYLSGPSFAREVAQRHPTAVVVAAWSEKLAVAVQRAFNHRTFRVYRSNDVMGVEIGGALKNVIAIAAGAADGMGFGHNSRAGLISRGLAEISRMAVARGANPLTLAGLAGMGDLVLTCTGGLSRNRQVGMQLGKGRSLDEILGEMNMVAEGVKTARSVHDLAIREGVEMPICSAVYEVLYEDKSVQQALVDLMGRELKRESFGF